jgi:hypothetical protein
MTVCAYCLPSSGNRLIFYTHKFSTDVYIDVAMLTMDEGIELSVFGAQRLSGLVLCRQFMTKAGLAALKNDAMQALADPAGEVFDCRRFTAGQQKFDDDALTDSQIPYRRHVYILYQRYDLEIIYLPYSLVPYREYVAT